MPYDEAQDAMDLHDGEGMQLSEGWVAGLMVGARDSSGSWGAVAINDDDWWLLVLLEASGEAPQLWGDVRGPVRARRGRRLRRGSGRCHQRSCRRPSLEVTTRVIVSWHTRGFAPSKRMRPAIRDATIRKVPTTFGMA